METIRKKKIGEVHFQHRIWLNELYFYKEELRIFLDRLEEIASKNTSQEVRVSIEQFQKRFIIQRNEIDTLEHRINMIEDEAVRVGMIHLRRIDYEATEEYINIHNSMIQFQKLYKALKDDFNMFLCKYM